MITRSLTTTPFGLRLTYSIDGEHTWTEYIKCSSPPRFDTSAVTKSDFWANSLLGRIKGLCSSNN